MKKITMLVLAVVLAIGLLGVGYAKWSDTVTINGTISTGTVKIGINDVNTTDPVGTLDPIVVPDDTAPYPCPWLLATTEKKDVASAVSVNNGEIICNDCGGAATNKYYESVTETVTNAYPFYAPSTNLKLASCGSIPVKIETFSVTAESDPNNILDNVYYTWGYTVFTKAGVITSSGMGCSLEALVTALTGIQLHTCDYVQVKLQMIFLETTPQGASASFTISVTASQYNEVP